MNLAYEAMVFAREVHKDQKRKYTGNPYADHLAEVAGIAACITTFGLRPHVVTAVAWLHDCMEDQGVKFDDLCERFGYSVACAVEQLSDLEKGNRAERKAASRARLWRAWDWVQSIKCADIISNKSSIVEHDQAFAAVWLEEKRLMLEVLTRADGQLLAMARSEVMSGIASLAGVAA